MIVVDASAWVRYATAVATDVQWDALSVSGHWAVPEHFMTESANAIRGMWLGRLITDEQFDDLLERLGSADVDVWPITGLIPRIRELASNANAYDAAYLALAEELGCALVTADAKLARVPGIRCRVTGFA